MIIHTKNENLITEQGERIRLRYRLTWESGFYGITVLALRGDDAEEAGYPSLTRSYRRASLLFRALGRGLVTPASLGDILSDWQYAPQETFEKLKNMDNRVSI